MAKFKFELILSKSEARGVEKTLKDIYNTIKDPKNWIKGEYEEIVDLDDDSRHTYCLIGAARDVDGIWEDLTHAFMVANLPKGFDSTLDLDLDYGNMGDTITGAELVENFNDHKTTTHKKVLAWLRSLIAKADKIAKAPKQKKASK